MVKLTGSKDWLKSSEVNTGEKVTFVNEGSWEESRFTHPDGNPKHQFVIKVTHKGEEKSLTLNKVTRDGLSESWSDDTLDWVGKTCTIEKVKVMVGGAMKDSIILHAADDGTPAGEKVVDVEEEEGKQIPF